MLLTDRQIDRQTNVTENITSFAKIVVKVRLGEGRGRGGLSHSHSQTFSKTRMLWHCIRLQV